MIIINSRPFTVISKSINDYFALLVIHYLNTYLYIHLLLCRRQIFVEKLKILIFILHICTQACMHMYIYRHVHTYIHIDMLSLYTCS